MLCEFSMNDIVGGQIDYEILVLCRGSKFRNTHSD